MSTRLLDANVVIALTVRTHEHHDAAQTWLRGVDQCLLCPVTEGALVRFALRSWGSGPDALQLLEAITAHPRVRWIGDDLSYREVDLAGLRGHRQATDAYLVALARRHGAVLATFDSALAATWPEHTELIEGPAAP